MATHTVLLEVEYSKTQEEIDPYKFVLTADVERNEYIAPHIFVFERDLAGVDHFCAVATPINLTEFAANAPASGQVFFRRDSLELSFPSLSELNEVFDALELDIQKLVDDYQILLDENLLISPSFSRTYTGN